MKTFQLPHCNVFRVCDINFICYFFYRYCYAKIAGLRCYQDDGDHYKALTLVTISFKCSVWPIKKSHPEDGSFLF